MPMLRLEEESDSETEFFLFLSNLHALTKENFRAEDLWRNSVDIVKLYIACGFSPDRFFFVQTC